MDTEAIWQAIGAYGNARWRGRSHETDAADHLSDIKRLLKEAEDEHKSVLDENERLVDEVNEARKEIGEQARLNGMGAEREARLMAEVAELKAKLTEKAELLRGCYAADHKRQKRVVAMTDSLKSIVDCCLEDHAARDYASRQTEILGIARAALKEDKT